MILVIGIFFEAAAAYYQYVLDYGPCALCVQVRALVLGFTLTALVAALVKNTLLRKAAHLLNTVWLAWLSERAYVLLGTERGFVMTECGMDSAFPNWLALDRWLPAFFAPWESCGYTPLVLFNISMAEMLILIYPLMFLLSLLLLVFSFFRHR